MQFYEAFKMALAAISAHKLRSLLTLVGIDAWRKARNHFDGTALRGMNPRPRLPSSALAGLAVQSEAVTQRFLRDYYKTLGECFRDRPAGRRAVRTI